MSCVRWRDRSLLLAPVTRLIFALYCAPVAPTGTPIAASHVGRNVTHYYQLVYAAVLREG